MGTERGQITELSASCADRHLVQASHHPGPDTAHRAMDHEIAHLLLSHSSLTSRDVLRMALVCTTWRETLSVALGDLRAAAAVTGRVVVLKAERGTPTSLHGIVERNVRYLFVLNDVHEFSKLMRKTYIDAPCFGTMWRTLLQQHAADATEWMLDGSEPPQYYRPGWALAIPQVPGAPVRRVSMLAKFGQRQVEASLSAQQHLMRPGQRSQLLLWGQAPWASEMTSVHGLDGTYMIVFLVEVFKPAAKLYNGTGARVKGRG